MVSFPLLLSVVAATTVSALDARATPTSVIVPGYGPCGGIGHTGGTVCAVGYTCYFYNEYESLCWPPSMIPSSTSTTASRTTTTRRPGPTYPPAAQPFGQCGGVGWQGPTSCVAGYYCHFIPQYSLCLPNPSTTPPLPPPATKVVKARASPTTIVPYGQCGGKRWIGSNYVDWQGLTTCYPGFYCYQGIPNYHICLPITSSSSLPVPTATEVAKVKARVASASPTGSVQLPYGMCGGIGWTGPTKCTEGYTCYFYNQYESLCWPPSMIPSSTTFLTTTTTTTASSASETAFPYWPCGGKDWTGPTKCSEGYICWKWTEEQSFCWPPNLNLPSTSSKVVTTTTKRGPPAPPTPRAVRL